MLAITVPTINSNDSDALLQAWLKSDGTEVRKGETLAVLETTKASFDLCADADGLLHTAALAGQRYAYGVSLGWIFTDAAEREQFFISRSGASASAASGEYVITRAAQALIDQYRLDEALVRSLGKKVIKGSDIEELLRKTGTSATQNTEPTAAEAGRGPLPVQQQSIARVVSRSRAAIPDSFILKKVHVDAALCALGEFSQAQKALAGLPDLLVWIAARLPAQFPNFFGALYDDLTFAASNRGNIGVTFDVGHGLFIPVIREAAGLSLKEIAKQMMQFRMRTARNSFRSEDLIGGDLTISLNMDADVLCVVPVILPPQTCMLSVSAVLEEVVLDAGGQPMTRRYLQLGAAFDHRAINGFAANAFLNALKVRLEKPVATDW